MIKTDNKPLASELIEDDKQMLETSRYVHLNLVKAKMVEKPSQYIWSSYTMFIGKKEEKLINSEIVLKYFKYEERFMLYEEFIKSKIYKDSFEKITNTKLPK